MSENRPASVFDRYHRKIVVLQLAESYAAVTAPGRPFLARQEQRDPTTNELRQVTGRPATNDIGGLLEVHPDGSGGISLVLRGIRDPDEDKQNALDIVLPDPKIVAFCTCVSAEDDAPET